MHVVDLEDFVTMVKIAFVFDNLSKYFIADHCFALRTSSTNFSIIVSIHNIQEGSEIFTTNSHGSGVVESLVFGNFLIRDIISIRTRRDSDTGNIESYVIRVQCEPCIAYPAEA